MKCFNETTGKLIADNLKMVDGFFGRLVGLLATSALKHGQGIVLKPCTQIHTFFMRFSIDAVFIDKEFNVLYVIEDMKPWRLSPLLLKSMYTVELSAGSLKGSVKAGDKICFK